MALGACSSKKEEPAPVDDMSWKLVSDGAPYVNETTSTTQARVVGNAIEVIGTVNPYGPGPDKRMVILHVPTMAVGKYVIGNSQVEASATYKLFDNGQEIEYFVNNHRAGGGNITITALTATSVEGTFEFKAYNSLPGTATTDRYLYDGTFRVRR
jgi:hypothetical protein